MPPLLVEEIILIQESRNVLHVIKIEVQGYNYSFIYPFKASSSQSTIDTGGSCQRESS